MKIIIHYLDAKRKYLSERLRRHGFRVLMLRENSLIQKLTALI
jgi:hypothetical protein